MEVINNTSKTLRDDLSVEIKEGSKLSIAAACFSIYAFQALKDELQGIDELRFIFTSPTVVTEKAKKEKRKRMWKRENFLSQAGFFFFFSFSFRKHTLCRKAESSPVHCQLHSNPHT